MAAQSPRIGTAGELARFLAALPPDTPVMIGASDIPHPHPVEVRRARVERDRLISGGEKICEWDIVVLE